ncbi:MAG: 4-hydroxy-3-methylbut-2-enyl diphosphate reductase, partial [Deltaproteobacteria bacterium]|nr:4-hydroxy-3-methylbut-2-enyl diphosphate reductase [Deltaproteobacteria bacterium]
MKITVARNAGFCFGVRRAIDITFKIREKFPEANIYTVGQIIHNPQVIKALEKRGIGIINDPDDPRLKPGDIAIIRAHGISPQQKTLLKKRGVRVIDAACPMVRKVQNIIKKAVDSADVIAIVGDKDHPEMDAHLGVAGVKGKLIQNLDDAGKIPHVNRLAVVAQTTFDVSLYKEIMHVLHDKADVIDVYDTICRSTVDRQNEVQELSKDHETLIVIGGRNSANTARLAEIAGQNDREVIRIDSPRQLEGIDTSHMKHVAVIAGASTPHWVIEESIERLKRVGKYSGIRNLMLDVMTRTPLFPALGSVGLSMITLVFCSQRYHPGVLAIIFFLAFASLGEVRLLRQWIIWCLATGLALSIALLTTGLTGGMLIAGVALLRPLLSLGRSRQYYASIYGALIMILVSIILPMGLLAIAPKSGIILLIAYALVHYLGVEVLIGLKNMEKDAIIGRMSLARSMDEERIVLLMEYIIMGLALILFLSFPLKITPALAYGLLPPLFFLAKGIDFYNEHVIF